MEPMCHEDGLYLGADSLQMYFEAVNLDEMAKVGTGKNGGEERSQG